MAWLVRLLAITVLMMATDHGGIIAMGLASENRAASSKPVHYLTTLGPHTDLHLLDIACPSTAVCYAVGVRGETTPIASIVRTTDGGRSWTVREIDRVSILNRIICRTIDVCYALGQILSDSGGAPESIAVTTVDGGVGWRTFPVGTDSTRSTVLVLGLACPDSNICYAVGTVFDSPGRSPSGVVLTSFDGAITWQSHLMHNRPLVSIACPTTTTCYVVGGRVDRTGTHAVFMVTADAGRTWKRRNLVGLDGLYSIACPAERTCYDVGYQKLAGDGSGHGVIVTTADTGKTWPQRYTTAPADIALQGLSCPNLHLCYVVGEHGRVVITRNSGRSWRGRTIDAGVDQDAISCSDERVCYTVGWQRKSSTAVIERTSDAGKSWDHLQGPP